MFAAQRRGCTSRYCSHACRERAYRQRRRAQITALRQRIALRRRVSVSDNAVQLGVRHVVGPTNGRNVPVPALVFDELSVQCKGKAPGDLVFADPRGSLPRPKSDGGWFASAVKRAKVHEISPHDLRHTCGSLAVSAGVDVRAFQRMPGRTSAKVTLNTYADLFDDDLGAVAVALHAGTRVKLLESVGKMWARERRAVASQRETAAYLRKAVCV